MSLSDRQLDQRLARLRHPAEPDPRLWQGIAPKLARRRRVWPLWLSAGSAVAAVVLLTVLAVPPRLGSPLDASDRIVGAEIRAMDAHAPSVADLEGARLGEVLGGAWDENEEAIAELEQALARQPGNPMLIQFLAQARLRQSELIHQATVGEAMAEFRRQ